MPSCAAIATLFVPVPDANETAETLPVKIAAAHAAAINLINFSYFLLTAKLHYSVLFFDISFIMFYMIILYYDISNLSIGFIAFYYFYIKF